MKKKGKRKVKGMNDSAPAMNDSAPATNDSAPAMNDLAHAMNDLAPAMNDLAPAINDSSHAMNDLAPAINDSSHATNDLEMSKTNKMGKVFCFIGIIVGTQFIVSLPAVANTTWVSGHITSDASWTKANSPYIVEGNVYVDSLVTLTIEPGVEVRLDSMKRIEITGTLNAIGTGGDSIIISALDTTKRWSRLRFKPVSVGSLKYCRIEYANKSAIFDSLSASLLIEHNTITNNLAHSEVWYYGGGGICCYYNSPIIRNNIITNNHTTKDGGGIRCYYGSPIITNNIISGNSAGAEECGGGISCPYGSPTVNGNTISNNSASTGGGIECGSDTISNNIIINNIAYSGGGGINCWSATIIGNTITGNISHYMGGGIRSTPTGVGAIIYGNTITNNWAPKGGNIWGYGDFYGALRISHNTLSDTASSNIYLFSSLDSNAIIDSNNIYASHYAIYNEDNNDIDARHNYWGTTDSATIANQKIWDFYDNSAKGIVHYKPFLTEPFEFGIEEASNYQLTINNYQLSIYPNPSRGKFVIRYSLNEKYNDLRLTIHDISGRLVESFGLDKSSPYKNVIKWEPKNLVSGIYFVKLIAGNFSEVQKITIVK